MEKKTKIILAVLASATALVGIYFVVNYFKIKSAYENYVTVSEANKLLQQINVDTSILDNSPEDATADLPHGNTNLSVSDDDNGDDLIIVSNDLQQFDVMTGDGDF
jgi:hypothetical protein